MEDGDFGINRNRGTDDSRNRSGRRRWQTAVGTVLSAVFLSACSMAFTEAGETGAEFYVELEQDGSQVFGREASVDVNTITITEGGAYRFTGSLSDGQIRVDAGKEKVTIILDGVSITNVGDAAICVEAAEQVTILLKEGTENLVQSRNSQEKDSDSGQAEEAAVYSRDDLIIGGTGSLEVLGERKHGIQSRKSLILESGSITVEAVEDGLKADETLRVTGGSIRVRCGEKAFQSDDVLEIAGGLLQTDAGDDAFHSNRRTEISGGRLTIATEEKGIHADEELIVDGGEILISDSWEGLEAKQVLIRSGKITITAADDGINANGEPEEDAERRLPCLRVQGGEISINADGDGMDSNGDLIFEGGTTVIFGPEDDQNGALDYGSESGGRCLLNGGTVLAAGSSCMAVTFSDASDQPSFLCLLDFTYEVGDEIRISDKAVGLLFSCTAVKKGSSVVFGSPELEVGQTLLLSVGEKTVEIELRSNAVTVESKRALTS